MNPKFSICLAVYNGEKYLKECIYSILNQSFEDFELIVVDDKSTDNSVKLLQEYQDERLKLLLNEENRGPLYSKYVAIKEAKGEYLIFLDADDYYTVDTLETINSALQEKDYDLVFYGFRQFIDDKELSVKKQEQQVYDKNNRSEFLLKVLLDNGYNSLWQKAVKRSIFDKIELLDNELNIRRGDDKFLSAYIYKYAYDIKFIDDVLYNYRQNEQGITQKAKKKTYYIEYQDKEAIKNEFYREECLKEHLTKFDKLSEKQLKSQILTIASLDITIDEKKNLFEQIKKEGFYTNYLQGIASNSSIKEIHLFNNNKYKEIILIAKLKGLFK